MNGTVYIGKVRVKYLVDMEQKCVQIFYENFRGGQSMTKLTSDYMVKSSDDQAFLRYPLNFINCFRTNVLFAMALPIFNLYDKTPRESIKDVYKWIDAVKEDF